MKLKKLLSVLTLTTFTVPATLSVVACGSAVENTRNKIKNISDLSNYVPKELSVSNKSDISDVIAEIRNAFLTATENTYLPEDFSENLNVTIANEDGSEITNNDTFKENKNVIVKATFSYKNNVISQQIKINVVSDNEYIAQSFKDNEYTLDTPIFNEKIIQEKINGEFLQKHLKNSTFRNIIDKDKFTNIQILDQDGEKINFNNVSSEISTYKAKIVAEYNSLPIIANLKININPEKTELSDQNVADIISNAPLKVSISPKDKVEKIRQDFNKQLKKAPHKLPGIITPIKDSLNPKLSEQIQWNKLELSDSAIKDEKGNELTAKTIRDNNVTNGVIGFQFGGQKGSIKVEFLNDKKTVREEIAINEKIKKIQLTRKIQDLEPNIDTLKTDLTTKIKGHKTLKSDLRFKPKDFVITQLLNKNGVPLTAKDLKEPGQKNWIFKFNYQDLKNEKGNFTINLVPNDFQMVNKIKEHTYSLALKNATELENLGSQTNFDAIKKAIKNEVDNTWGKKGFIATITGNSKSYLNPNLLVITKINQPKKETKEGILAETTFDYTYNGKKGTANLKILEKGSFWSNWTS